MKTFLYFFRGLFVIMCLSGVMVVAQVESGVISGTITDQSGASVTGATVTVTNLSTNASRTTVSSNSGSYSLLGLEPATYQVTVESASFKPFNGKVEVTTGGHVTLDAKLSVSGAITEIEVVAEGGAQVNTQTQDLSQVVDRQQIQSLPSLTRNPYDFVAISGNVSNGEDPRKAALTAYLEQRTAEGFLVETRSDTQAVITRHGPRSLLRRLTKSSSEQRRVVAVDENGHVTARAAEPIRW